LTPLGFRATASGGANLGVDASASRDSAKTRSASGHFDRASFGRGRRTALVGDWLATHRASGVAETAPFDSAALAR
jgi:hypothetical protein